MQNEGTVKVRRLTLSCPTLIMTVSKSGSKAQPCDAATLGLTAYKSALYKETSTTLKDMQLNNSFAVRVSGTSLFIVIKYTRLKPRLIKNKFLQNIINLD